MTQHNRREVDDDEDDRGKPGRHVKVSLLAMDSLDPIQQQVARDTAAHQGGLPLHERAILDNAARLAKLGHLGASYVMRPGMVQPAGTMAAADAAYHEMVEATSSAWRDAQTRAPTAAEPQQQQPPPPVRANDSERAYAEMVERTRNAWRTAA